MIIAGRQISRETWSREVLSDLRERRDLSAEELEKRLEKTNPYFDKRKRPVFAPVAELAVKGLEKRSERIVRHIDALDGIMQKIQDYSILKKGSRAQQEAHKYLLSRLEHMWQLLANGQLKEFVSAYEDMKLVPIYERHLPERMVFAAKELMKNKKLSSLAGSVKLTEAWHQLE